ncbi:MAG: glycosyltransferase family 2 protein [Deltaproteobacteria bacterium]|nr:glycosyltransferase family 2 protein [Deltaproteobacteria bacterium]
MLTTPELPLSVSIISFNEAANIGRTLDSIKTIASEIIVVDSHSTDDTRKIALKYGANVYAEDWKGHIRQKNSALEKCTQPWILSLDSDEVVSEALCAAIVAAVRTPGRSGYRINRRTFYLGKLLRYAWQPDWKLRLVRKDADPLWAGYDPHDRLEMAGRSGRLKGDLIHYSYTDLRDHMQRLVTYAEITANSYHKNGIFRRQPGFFRVHEQFCLCVFKILFFVGDREGPGVPMLRPEFSTSDSDNGHLARYFHGLLFYESPVCSKANHGNMLSCELRWVKN